MNYETDAPKTEPSPKNTIMSILIDPYAMLFTSEEGLTGLQPANADDMIRWVERENTLPGIYAALNKDVPRIIKERVPPVEYIEGVPLGGWHGSMAYVDEQALLHDGPKVWWSIEGFPNPIAGRGLVVGVDKSGDDLPPSSAVIGDLLSRIRFGCDQHEIWFRPASTARADSLDVTHWMFTHREHQTNVVKAWLEQGRIRA